MGSHRSCIFRRGILHENGFRPSVHPVLNAKNAQQKGKRGDPLACQPIVPPNIPTTERAEPQGMPRLKNDPEESRLLLASVATLLFRLMIIRVEWGRIPIRCSVLQIFHDKCQMCQASPTSFPTPDGPATTLSDNSVCQLCSRSFLACRRRSYLISSACHPASFHETYRWDPVRSIPLPVDPAGIKGSSARRYMHTTY